MRQECVSGRAPQVLCWARGSGQPRGTPVTEPHLAAVFQSLRIAKELLRQNEKETLHAVNAEECRVLQSRWLSDECMSAVMAFMAHKGKL